MTGILIYSVKSVFSRAPLSQANVKPSHSKPTLIASKLKHDITSFPEVAASGAAHLTHEDVLELRPWKMLHEGESIKIC